MKTFLISKAQPIIKDKPIEDVEIKINSEVETFDDFKEYQKFYEGQALYLADALQYSLPGGTFHALLIEMLRRKENLLTVRDIRD